ncbi:helix-turn-helix domain-containing protein [Thalassobacillus sp. CUG 92003]|uniref:AraC family transcriptional regulator n=1 Tax=Thalassobacillus sp. CUG 92003 TaxID=2736641 RepID=UPI0015E6EDDA|nr:helix-turn-helix domain-containing protein [Thalassobacillus sp. CUG 92003]
MTMNVELAMPHRLLRPWIECYWHVELDRGGVKKTETILPNGKIELIFALEGNYHVLNRNSPRVKHAWLSGLHHTPLHIEYSGKSRLYGIRFRPHGIFPFFDIPIHETVNQVENLEYFWGALQGEMFEALCSAPDMHHIFNMFDYFLLDKISERKTRHQRCISYFVNQVCQDPTLSIPQVAAALGFTQRHMNRLIKDHIGLPPKLLAQIYRFEQSFSCLYQHPIDDLPDLTPSLGFYDQSHFIKEFKRFSGMTPREYKKNAFEAENFL